MGKHDDSEFRACAAMALGKINTPKATESLNRAAGEKDVIVQKCGQSRHSRKRNVTGAPVTQSRSGGEKQSGASVRSNTWRTK